MQHALWPGYVTAVVFGWLGFVLFCLLSLRFEPANTSPLALSIAISLVIAAAIAFRWPAGSWRLGLWASSGFSTYLSLVFLSFLLQGELEWMPALEAIAITLTSCLGATVGQRLSPRWQSSRSSLADR